MIGGSKILKSFHTNQFTQLKLLYFFSEFFYSNNNSECSDYIFFSPLNAEVGRFLLCVTVECRDAMSVHHLVSAVLSMNRFCSHYTVGHFHLIHDWRSTKTSCPSLNITQNIVHTAETQTANGIDMSAFQQIINKRYPDHNKL